MTGTVTQQTVAEPPTADGGEGLKKYYTSKNEELQLTVAEKNQNLRRLQAQRNELNAKVRMLREELQLLQEQGSYVGEVVKAMDKKKVLVKVHPKENLLSTSTRISTWLMLPLILGLRCGMTVTRCTKFYQTR